MKLTFDCPGTTDGLLEPLVTSGVMLKPETFATVTVTVFEEVP
jgi:hypothetical protein